MSLSPALLEILTKTIEGEVSLEELIELLKQSTSQQPALAEDVGQREDAEMAKIAGATVDLGRQSRCGFGEVIYGAGKSPELMLRIIESQLKAGQTAFVTRLDENHAGKILSHFPGAHHNPVAKTLRVSNDPSAGEMGCEGDRFHVAVVSAGSTDLPVAEEAMETLAWMRVPTRRYEDIGVAGPQRLVDAIPRISKASAVVVVAGMEGALPPVVAGHLSVPVIAVPTSVGYGTNFGGLTPLFGMLSACAPSVGVVNIDAGFKGGYLAGMIVSQLIRVHAESQA